MTTQRRQRNDDDNANLVWHPATVATTMTHKDDDAMATTQRQRNHDDGDATTTTHWRHQLRNATRRECIKHADVTTLSYQRLNRCIHERRDLTVELT